MSLELEAVTTDWTSQVDGYLALRRQQHLEQLVTFLSIPSISTLPSHQPDMRRAATWLSDELRRIGMRTVTVMETGGHPVVYAERYEAPTLPTALVYGHYDVQPADPLEAWRTPPFQPVIRDGRIYARGAHDDKGQVFMHLKVIEAILAVRGRFPVNLKFLVEGEEEVGSPHLEAFLRRHRAMLTCDVVIISDTNLYDRGVPSLTCGLRGVAALEVTVRGAERDLHSGTYGGLAPNAAHALARLVASLHTPEGRIAVPGFYDDIRPLSQEEEASFHALAFDEDRLMQELGVPALAGEPGYSALERVWCRPSIDVCGLGGGYQGDGVKTIVPGSAWAKITCRLVPDQDPNRILDALERHLIAHCPPGVTLSVVRDEGSGRPYLAPLDHPAVTAALTALSEVYQKPARLIRSGGSIPIVPAFQEILGAPSVLLGFGLASDAVHAPNEHFLLENFERGMHVLNRYWFRLAETLAD